MSIDAIANNKTKCFSCNAQIDNIEGEVHKYMDASPGCWKLFRQILAKEYSDPAYWKNHRITVDAYAVQHFGKPSLQAIQSVNLHLSSLCLIFDKKFDIKSADKGLTRLAKYKSELFWLDPPNMVGEMTVSDILKAKTASEHCNLVFDWGKSVWDAWSFHHKTIQAFIERHQNEIY